MGLTVDELLDKMTSTELAEWMAFYCVEPFGDEWKQTGLLCSMVGNAAGGKRGGRQFTYRDFLPVKPIYQVVRQTGKQMLAIFRTMATVKGK